MREDILSTETIFDGRIVHLKVHTVRLPDGNESKRELIHHQGAVAIVAVDQYQHVLLVKQFRLGTNDDTIEIPAGILEPNEDPQAAVARELREETGYRPLNVESLGGMYVAPGYTTEYIHLYYASGYEKAPLEQDADEFVEALRIPLKDAVAMVERGEIVEGKSIVALLKIARKLGI
ncbi:MAG: NUDIX hydrolase [Anaerolineae bacterium]|nr:NUDIX hydrolase [Anaerolineae bacterium]